MRSMGIEHGCCYRRATAEKRCSYTLNRLFFLGMAQESTVPNAHESFGDGVEQKSTNEVMRLKGGCLCSAAIFVVPVPKRDPAPID